MASSAIPFSHLNLHLPLSRASLARADCLATTRCRFPSVTRSCLADASSALLQAAKHTVRSLILKFSFYLLFGSPENVGKGKNLKYVF